jgi:hypothetical protein
MAMLNPPSNVGRGIHTYCLDVNEKGDGSMALYLS